MVDLILLELITLLSFFYSLILMYSSFASINVMVVLFAWDITIGFVFALLMKKSRLSHILPLLMLLPLYFFKDKTAVFLIVLTGFFSYLYIMTTIGRVHYLDYVNRLKITYFIFTISMFFRLSFNDLTGSISYALPFVIIYFLSSIVLTRIMRHLDSNMDIKKIRKTNVKYIIGSGVLFILAVYEGLRSILLNILNKIITALYYPIYFIMRNIRINLGGLEAEQEFLVGEPEVILEELPPQIENDKLGEQFIKAFNIFTTVVVIIFSLALIYVLYKLFIKPGSGNSQTREYTEEREYIRANKKKKRRLFKERFPKELKEQVRYYYRRYLEKLKRNKVELSKADTSLEVNERAGELYSEGIDRIREIYIGTRYGDKDIDQNTVKEIEGLYKKL